MSSHNCNERFQFKDKFSLIEIILIRTGFFGMLIIGAYSILDVNPIIGYIYSGLVVTGLVLLIDYSFCPYCPYPSQFSQCLFFPLWMVKQTNNVSGNKPSRLKKRINMVIFLIFAIIPQFWLLKNITLFFIYWIMFVLTIGRVTFCICSRCRYLSCPMNRVKKNMELFKNKEFNLINEVKK